MTQYRIKEAFQLQSHPQRLLLQPGQYYATEVPEELKELERFVLDGSCEVWSAKDKPKGLRLASQQEGKAVSKEKDDENAGKNANPEEDITVVPGIGATLKRKLEEAGIVTVSALREAMATKPEEMKELLGNSFEKVEKYFA